MFVSDLVRFIHQSIHITRRLSSLFFKIGDKKSNSHQKTLSHIHCMIVSLNGKENDYIFG